MQKRDILRWVISEIQRKYKIQVVSTKKLNSIEECINGILEVTKEIYRKQFEKEKEEILEQISSISKENEKLKTELELFKKKFKKSNSNEEEQEKIISDLTKEKLIYKDEIEKLKRDIIELQDINIKTSISKDKLFNKNTQLIMENYDLTKENNDLKRDNNRLEKMFESTQKELENLYNIIHSNSFSKEKKSFLDVLMFWKR